MKRLSYQKGSVVRTKRASGPDVWVLRFRDNGKQRSVQLGTIDKLPTKASAERRAQALRSDINDRRDCITVAALCDRYEKDDMPARMSTSSSYRAYLKRIRADLGSKRLDHLANDVMMVEQWINGLRGFPTKRHPIGFELSKATKAHIKALVHRMFECAIRWGILSMQRNPISLVEVRGKNRRVRPLRLVTVAQYRNLLEDPELQPRVKVMVQIAMCLGLRASEILGLRWEDVDWSAGTVKVCRSHVGKHVDDVKTTASEEVVPVHEDLMAVLDGWKIVPDVKGWMFGNVATGRPYHRDSLQTDHLQPAGHNVGIQNLGWHSFRHTYRSMLRELELPLEVQQKLMRHADMKTTLSYGGPTSIGITRPAQARVFEMTRRRSA